MASLTAQLDGLRKQFGDKTTEQGVLKEKAAIMERRLTAASQLIAGLSSERTRWTQEMEVRTVALLSTFVLTAQNRQLEY